MLFFLWRWSGGSMLANLNDTNWLSDGINSLFGSSGSESPTYTDSAAFFNRNLLSPPSESALHDILSASSRGSQRVTPNEISAPYEVPQFPIEEIEHKLAIQRQLSIRYATAVLLQRLLGQRRSPAYFAVSSGAEFSSGPSQRPSRSTSGSSAVRLLCSPGSLCWNNLVLFCPRAAVFGAPLSSSDVSLACVDERWGAWRSTGQLSCLTRLGPHVFLVH